MWRALTIFFACCTAALLWWFVYPLVRSPARMVAPDEDIVFPEKTFAPTEAFVAAKGTMTADWVGFKNNTYSILCISTECIVANVEQIGPNQIGDVDGPVVYPVIHWSKDGEVVAQDDGMCARITITLDRRSETVLWVETPINQTTLACKNADNNVRKATLESSLYWQRSRARQRR